MITPNDIQRAPSNLVLSDTDQARTQNCSMLLLLNEVEKLGKELALLTEMTALKEAQLSSLEETCRIDIQSAENELKVLQRQVRIDTIGQEFTWYLE